MLSFLKRQPHDVRELQKELRQAKDAANLLLQTKVAESIAERILQRYNRDFEEIREYVDGQIIRKASIVQKMPALLEFYKKLIPAYDLSPSRVLEIGVKGGGSLMLWRELFPKAEIVGMDIKLPRTPPPDRVSYFRGDQSDASDLSELAAQHGPFDLVIDDGSHVADHQCFTFTHLIDHLTDGALYVVEDIEAVYAGTRDGKIDYGVDVWGDFIRAAFCMFQKGDYQDLPMREEFRPTLPRVASMLMSDTVFAMQIRPKTPA